MGLLGSLGSLNVLLSADTAQFTSAMEKASYKAEKSLNSFGIKAKLSLAAVATALIANTKNALEFADSIGDMADRLGMTSKQMSTLAYAAKMSDVEVGNLESTIKRMYVSAYKNSEAFQVLGVQIKDSSGRMRSGYDIFVDVAEAFEKMPDGVGKSSAAIEIFGKSGADIVPLLNSGKDGIVAFGEEAKRLGVLVEEETAKSADRFDKWVKKQTEVIKGLGIKSIDFFDKLILAIKATTDPYGVYLELLDRNNEKSKELTETTGSQIAAFEQAAEAADKKKKLEEEGVKLTNSLRTAQEIYNDELEKYNNLLSAGAINQETYERAIKKARDTLTESTQKTNKLRDASKDLGYSFQSAFEDAIIDGEEFSDVLSSLLEDIERIIIRTTVTAPLGNALSTGLNNLFASAHGNVFSNGFPMAFADGGLITRPTLFPMSNGRTGLAGEAGDEAIMPLFRDGNGDLGVKSGGNGGGVEINIYAPEGSSVSQSSQVVGDREQINIMIDEAVAGSVGKSSSKTYKALKNTFGLSQSLNTR